MKVVATYSTGHCVTCMHARTHARQTITDILNWAKSQTGLEPPRALGRSSVDSTPR